MDWNDGTVTDAQVTNDSSDSGLRVNVDLPTAPSNSVFTVHVAYDPTGPDQYIGAASSASAMVTLNQLPPGAVASPDAVYTLTGGSGAATLDLTAGSIAFNTNVAYTGSYWQNLNFTLSGSAHAYFNSPEDLGALTIQGNAIVSLSRGGGSTYGNRLNVQSLSIDPNATLDLTDNALIDWYAIGGGTAAQSQMQSWLRTGYAGGAWTGPGIDSSVAADDTTDAMSLGWMDNGYDYVDHSIDPSYLTFAGVNLQSKNQMLVRLAYYGDANLDGDVNNDDLALWHSGSNNLGYTGWVYGDFNYDGIVDNTADLGLYDADYGLTLNGPNFAPAFLPTGLVINPIEGVPFSGDLATFSDMLHPSNADPSIYLAQVDWGDGHFVDAQVTATASPGYFRINALSPALTDPNAVMTVTIKYADMGDPSPTYQGRPAAVSEPITMTPAVANPSAATASTNEIDLTWTPNAPNASAIEVDRSIDATNWDVVTDTLPGDATSYSDTTGLADATHYYYRVRAIWSAGPSAFTDSVDAWTLANAPSGLSASSSGTNEVDLSWTNTSAVATQFQIERSDDGTNFYTFDTATGTTYSDTFADDGSTYWYRVEALNGNGDLSLPSGAASASTTLAPPSELTATAISASEIDLAWSDDSVAATGYEIDRSTDGITFAPLGPNLAADTSSYSDTALDAGSHFYYRVVSLAGGQMSAPSNTADDTTVPPAPDSNWVTTTTSSVTVNWDAVQGATGYEVDRSVNGAWVDVGDLADGSTTSYTDTGLLSNTSFSYQIIARNNAGQSSPMGVSATTSVETPAAPSNVQAIALSPTSVEIVWQNNADNEEGFHVGYSDNGPGSYTTLGSTLAGTTNLMDTTIQPGQARTYAVQAYSSANGTPNNSDWSDPVTVTTANSPDNTTTPLPAPTNLKAIPTPGHIQLTWTPSTSPLVTSYWVERMNPGGNWGVIGFGGTSFLDKPALVNVTYMYRVVAADSTTTSAPSDPPAKAAVALSAPPAPNAVGSCWWQTGYKATVYWTAPRSDANAQIDGYNLYVNFETIGGAQQGYTLYQQIKNPGITEWTVNATADLPNFEFYVTSYYMDSNNQMVESDQASSASRTAQTKNDTPDPHGITGYTMDAQGGITLQIDG